MRAKTLCNSVPSVVKKLRPSIGEDFARHLPQKRENLILASQSAKISSVEEDEPKR